jgi:hypothetical protein
VRYESAVVNCYFACKIDGPKRALLAYVTRDLTASRYFLQNKRVKTGKRLVLDNADIDGLGNDELNRQLDFHQEEEKKHASMEDSEKVPLKSHMKYKADRVRVLKKAVTQYFSRLEGPSSAQLQQLAPTNDGFSTRTREGQDDTAYESDYHDDQV